MFSPRNLIRSLSLVGALALGLACSSNTPAGSSGAAGSGSGGTVGPGAGGATGVAGGSGVAGSTGAAGATGVAGSSGAAGSGTGAGGSHDGGYDGPNLGIGGNLVVGGTQCSDGIDNDDDGKIDFGDPECVGPLDDDEGSFATGIPGDNSDACKQDCFFDGNSGMGDDDCLWQLQCDPQGATGQCTYDADFVKKHANECSVSASQDQRCIDFCQKRTPNGCDCFGCCAVPGVATPIRLAATCTEKDFGDPTKCPPCTQVTQCANTCERCELCIGKTTVPADCGATPDAGTPGDAGIPQTCDFDAPACGADGSCPAGRGCVTGCCFVL